MVKLKEISPSGLRKTIPDMEEDDFKKEKRIVAYLLNNGFKYHAGGAFGRVYANEKRNIVVKFSRNYDDCYVHYVDYARTHKSPHLVRVSKPIQVGKNFYIYIIEKLVPVNEVYTGSELNLIVNAISYFYHITKGYSKIYSDPYRQDFIYFFRNHKRLLHDLQNLKRYFKNKCDIDMHMGNMMIRPRTKEFVITDPVSDIIRS